MKITETSYSVAEAQSVADFMHGPIAAVESGFPVLLIEANGPNLRQMRALGRDLCDRGARLLRLTDRTDGRDPLAVAVTTGLPESLTPLPFAVAGQLLALRRTLDKGLDPDRPPRGCRRSPRHCEPGRWRRAGPPCRQVGRLTKSSGMAAGRAATGWGFRPVR